MGNRYEKTYFIHKNSLSGPNSRLVTTNCSEPISFPQSCPILWRNPRTLARRRNAVENPQPIRQFCELPGRARLAPTIFPGIHEFRVGASLGRPPKKCVFRIPRPTGAGGTSRTPSPTTFENCTIENVGAGLPDGPPIPNGIGKCHDDHQRETEGPATDHRRHCEERSDVAIPSIFPGTIDHGIARR